MVAVEDGGAQTDERDGADGGHGRGSGLLGEVTSDEAGGGAEGKFLAQLCRCERHDVSSAAAPPLWHLVKMGGELQLLLQHFPKLHGYVKALSSTQYAL